MERDELNYILAGTMLSKNTVGLLTPDALMLLFMRAIHVNSTSIHNATHDFLEWKERSTYQYNEANELLMRSIGFHGETAAHFGAIRTLIVALANEIVELNETVLKAGVILDDVHAAAGYPLGEDFMPVRQMLHDAQELMEKFEGKTDDDPERKRLNDLLSGWNPQ